MKVIKPQRLSLLHRVVEHQGRCNLVVSAFAWVPLDAPRKLLTEQEMWIAVGEEVETGILDEGLPKPQAEVLLTAKACAVGEPAGAVMVRVKVDDQVDKQLAVWGNRYWLNATATDPVPFSEMPMGWANAFGGAEYATNPLGKGIDEVDTEHGSVVPLPNVEDPKELVVGPGDRPSPAGFGPLDGAWPQRFEKLGTYNSDYLETHFPGPAEDFDAHFYNAAPADQRMSRMFTGAETFVLEGMSPVATRIEGQLEPFVVRSFVTQKDGDEEHFREIKTRLDTLHFFPHLGRACLIFRGTLPVAEDDADDIVHLMIGAEAPEHPKPTSHYKKVLALRLDKDVSPLASLKDEDLMPPKAEGWSAAVDPGELGEMTRLEQPGLANTQRGRKKKLLEAREEMRAAGFDPDEVGPFLGDEPEPMPDPYDFDAVIEYTDKMEVQARDKLEKAQVEQVKMQEEAKRVFAEMGLDYEEESKKQLAEAGKPPTFRADEHLGMLHEMSRILHEAGAPQEDLDENLADPRFREVLEDLERRAHAAYRTQAHTLPATPPLDDDARTMLRVAVTAARDAGENLVARDLTGADLSELDLSGMDLSRAYLADANLTNANLQGAILSDAVLARADLTNTDMSGSNLDGTNFGAAKLINTRMSDCSMVETIFGRAIVDGAVLVGSKLQEVIFLETAFGSFDLSHIECEKLIFIDADLSRATCTGAHLTQCIFMQCDLHGVDFTGANLTQTQFLATNCDGCSFAGAIMESVVCVHETSMTACGFSGAQLTSANFRKTSLKDADFERATLVSADLSACDLRNANLHAIVARSSMWVRSNLTGANLRGANLLDAILSKAILFGADLTGSNLSRADLSRVRVDRGTQIDEALMIDTRVHPKHEANP